MDRAEASERRINARTRNSDSPPDRPAGGASTAATLTAPAHPEYGPEVRTTKATTQLWCGRLARTSGAPR
jgi:hypothetical protein